MLEYVFFNKKLTDVFTTYLDVQGCVFSVAKDPIDDDAQVVQIADLEDEEDEALWDRLDDLYDDLSEQDRQMMEDAGGEDAMSAAGIYIALKNGNQTVAKVDPEVMNRMLAVVSMGEFNAFVECIVQSVETPEVSPLCKQDPLG